MATVVEKRNGSRSPAMSAAPPAFLHRFSVAEYERMTELGFLTESHRVELLNGCIVDNADRMTQNPPHNAGIDRTDAAITPLLTDDWYVREQKAIRLPTSEPEPDIAVVRGPRSRYDRAHPTPADIGLLVEVSDSSLLIDRETKGPIFARARIPVYWIVNLSAQHVEVYTEPRGGKSAGYRHRQDYGVDDSVPLVIEGRELGRIPVRSLLPVGPVS